MGINVGTYLEDHPTTDVSGCHNHSSFSSPKDRVVGLQMAVLWLINGGDPNYLLTGTILQVHPLVN